jgi:hypothetical protein
MAISLLIFASLALAPTQQAFASFDGTPTINNPAVFGQTIDQQLFGGLGN